MCKIAILEDYSLFCSGIRPVLDDKAEVCVIVEAKQLTELLTKLMNFEPDLLIVDIIHCGNNGLKIISKIRKKYSSLPVLLIVNKDFSEYFEKYISQGVRGIVLTTLGSEDLVKAVRSIINGEDYFPPQIWTLLKDYLRTKRKDISFEKESKTSLTDRELSVLKLFCQGLSYKEIAASLHISPRTVETHKKNITGKLKVRSIAEMVHYAIQNNLN